MKHNNSPRRPTLLVANRGEIAMRIMRTARAEGYRTIAIYSDPDRNAPHTRAADVAIGIGGRAPQESYLDIERVIAAAIRGGATAVHPGYGFLSENAGLARACIRSGLEFIGPPPEAIEAMANKRRAKALMEQAGVPCIPGFALPEQHSNGESEMLHAAAAIGFPLMVKAADGGGGRGMRLVENAEELPARLRSARSESKSAFGSDEIILEKALVDARHVEVQVFADCHGNIIHLGERDCSIQRRHQKIVEESPSPAVGADLRRRMGEAAVAAARACNYIGAGTVEFLLDRNGDFYFLEMNTRLQVEHPVTEMVTGLDLVAWQLAVARGEPLPISQQEVKLAGHAIEVRLYAEDPDNHFLPQSGEILHWQEPAAPGIRCDHAIATGGAVTPFYDPMLGKLIAHGRDREQARMRLLNALSRIEFIGPRNNFAFLQRVIDSPVFAAGGATTAFLAEQEELKPTGNPDHIDSAQHREAAIAATVMYRCALDPADCRSGRANWRNGDNSVPVYFCLQRDGRLFECRLRVHQGRSGIRVESGGENFDIEVVHMAGDRARLAVDGIECLTTFSLRGARLHLLMDGQQAQWEDHSHFPASAAQARSDGLIRAPMDGTLVELCVTADQAVQCGDTVAVIEAMKMEHPLKADCDGTVGELAARPGDQVRGGQVLARIEPVPQPTPSIT
ncbi:acetyl/propionyl/methylcrotonyl-CoA carboxylase subunit alpha [Microbulbifer yueqingensis]|uniref:Geranyl-CoA carboxylase alpha subunit n=1 Tax=Microbulbifer yueqingensis TaxID=658219 RepID=A0A1G8ZDY8_9GAMM|nr:biotin carboxylase N-terminal domain-containing protein [Microbulbifer yueqingensis]SDK13247.1 geranyl-CoA carboxylase alpha subunit [Microbulbifer yueqingensis]